MRRPALAPGLVIVLAALSCACARRFPTPRPSVLRFTRPAPTIEVSRCEPAPEPPLALAPASRPTTEGVVSLLDVRGEDRFSVRGVMAGAWSDDGARVYVATHEAVFVWAARTGALELVLPYGAPLSNVYGIAVGAGERFVAVAGVGMTARPGGYASELAVVLLQTRGERRVRAFRGATGSFVRTSDGRRALVAGHAWDLEEGTWRPLPALPEEPRFAPDGSRALVYLPALAPRGALVPVLYDVERGVELHRFAPIANTRPAGFSGDSRRLAMIGEALEVYDTRTFERVARVAEVSEGSAVALSYDGRLAAVGVAPRYANVDGAYRTIPARALVWDLDAGAARARAEGVGGAPWEFSRDGRYLVGSNGAEANALFRVADLARVPAPARSYFSWGDEFVGTHALALAPDGSALLVRHDDSIELFPVEGPAAVSVARRAPVLARSPDGSRSASLDGEGVRIEGRGACARLGFAREVAGRRGPDRSFRMGQDEVRFSEDGGALFVLGGRHDGGPVFRAFDAATGRERWSVAVGGRARAALGADALVVQGADRDEVLRFDATTGELALAGRPPRLEEATPLLGGPTYARRAPRGYRVSNLELALPGPGPLVATVGNFDDDVWFSVWDLRDPERVVDHLAGGFVLRIANAPRTGVWAVGLHGGGVRLFGPGGAAPVTVDARHGGRVSALAFAPDGSRLASAGADGSIAVADARTGAVVGRARVNHDAARLLWISPDGAELRADTERGLTARFRLAR